MPFRRRAVIPALLIAFPVLLATLAALASVSIEPHRVDVGVVVGPPHKDSAFGAKNQRQQQHRQRIVLLPGPHKSASTSVQTHVLTLLESDSLAGSWEWPNPGKTPKAFAPLAIAVFRPTKQAYDYDDDRDHAADRQRAEVEDKFRLAAREGWDRGRSLVVAAEAFDLVASLPPAEARDAVGRLWGLLPSQSKAVEVVVVYRTSRSSHLISAWKQQIAMSKRYGKGSPPWRYRLPLHDRSSISPPTNGADSSRMVPTQTDAENSLIANHHPDLLIDFGALDWTDNSTNTLGGATGSGASSNRRILLDKKSGKQQLEREEGGKKRREGNSVKQREGGEKERKRREQEQEGKRGKGTGRLPPTAEEKRPKGLNNMQAKKRLKTIKPPTPPPTLSDFLCHQRWDGWMHYDVPKIVEAQLNPLGVAYAYSRYAPNGQGGAEVSILDMAGVEGGDVPGAIACDVLGVNCKVGIVAGGNVMGGAERQQSSKIMNQRSEPTDLGMTEAELGEAEVILRRMDCYYYCRLRDGGEGDGLAVLYAKDDMFVGDGGVGWRGCCEDDSPRDNVDAAEAAMMLRELGCRASGGNGG